MTSQQQASASRAFKTNAVDPTMAKLEVDSFAQENAPIKRVVLYKHGIALFERQVNLSAGDSSVPLLFHKDEIDSVLKSMTVIDESKEGVVKSVSYESEVSLVPLIKKRPLIGDQVYNIERLLFHLRGVHIGLEIEGSAEKEDGVCVGIEKNSREIILTNNNGASGVHRSDFTEVTILSNDNMLKSFALDKIKNVLILNSTVAREVNEALRKSFLARQQEPEDPRRELTIFLAGQDARKVSISYVISFPSWNATYRATVAGDAGLKLECWGMINNAREEDWIDATVALVSGQTLNSGAGYAQRQPQQQQQQQQQVFRPNPPPGMPQQLGQNTFDQQHFIYKVAQPVTVKATQSALVPVFNTTIASRRVAVINSTCTRHPLMAMFMKNTTTKPFPAGSISLIDDDIVIGNGTLPGLKPNDTLLLPYAVDTSCTYTASPSLQTKYVNAVELRDGSLYATRQQTRDTYYSIENNALQGEVEVIIEHAKFSQLLSPAPFEEIDGMHRFSVKVGPGKKECLTVKEQGTTTNVVSIDLNIKRKTVNKWLEDKLINQNLVALLEPVLAMAEKSDKMSKDLELATKQLDEIMADGVRILQNLESMSEALQSSNELTNRWVTMVIQLDENFLQLRNQIRDMTNTATHLEEEFTALLETLKSDRTAINQGLEATIDLNAHKFSSGSGSFTFGGAGKGAPQFQRYKDYIQNVGDNLSAVYRARSNNNNVPSPQYQQVQNMIQQQKSSNYSSPSYSQPPQPQNSYGGGFGTSTGPSLPPTNTAYTKPPGFGTVTIPQPPQSASPFTFGTVAVSSPPLTTNPFEQRLPSSSSSGNFSFNLAADAEKK